MCTTFENCWIDLSFVCNGLYAIRLHLGNFFIRLTCRALYEIRHEFFVCTRIVDLQAVEFFAFLFSVCATFAYEGSYSLTYRLSSDCFRWPRYIAGWSHSSSPLISSSDQSYKDSDDREKRERDTEWLFCFCGSRMDMATSDLRDFRSKIRSVLGEWGRSGCLCSMVLRRQMNHSWWGWFDRSPNRRGGTTKKWGCVD